MRARAPGWWDRVCRRVPELGALEGVLQPARYHPEGDVAEHTRRAVEAVSPGAPSAVLWAVLLHDLGKAFTTRIRPDGRITAHGHAERGAAQARGIMARLGAPRDLAEEVEWLVRHHGFPLSWNLASPVRLGPRQKRLLSNPRFGRLLQVARADQAARGPAGRPVLRVLAELDTLRENAARHRGGQEEGPMSKAMIISVGGTPEPVVKTLETHGPEFVCFFCSEATVENVGQIKAMARERGVEVRNRNVMVSDPEDLAACYRGALEACDRVESAGYPPEDVVVDYTGGTKTMSAALVLATVNRGYGFSYVGGTARDKKGQGVVLSGHEVVRTGMTSPWRVFAVEEKRTFAALFNRHLYRAAAEVMERALVREPSERRLLAALRDLARAYQHWDAFRHAQAKEFLKGAIEGLSIRLEHVPDPGLSQTLNGASATLDFLKRLQQDTRGFRRMSRLQVVDLLANAGRRARGGRADDAVGRLYRALELVAQIAFEEAFGCPTGNADPDRLPEDLRERYRHKYWNPQVSACQIPLRAAFEALAAAGRLEGVRFVERAGEFEKILYARNHSILAHGFTPVAPDLPERFEALIRDAFGIRERVEFPEVLF